MIITINGREHSVVGRMITYEMLSVLGYGKVIDGMSCTWFDKKNNDGGILHKKDNPIPLLDGMTFSIMNTGAA